jgi:ABC-type nickel/cobalt efflux system permease component RcnA
MLRALLLTLALLFAAAPVSAQDPFAAPPAAEKTEPQTQPAPSWTQSIVSSVQNWQSQLYREVATSLRALKQQGAMGPLLALLGIAFMYGVLHAAGPGHGKAVIAAYLAADDSAFARGIVLSFLSSAAQAFTAIAGVGVLALIVGMIARDVSAFAFTLERISYFLIAGIGLYLVWRGVSGWLLPGRSVSHSHARSHSHSASHNHAHDHDHGHVHGPECGHDHSDHLALPQSKPILGNLRETAAVVFSIGIRPCQGSVFILLLALAMGVFWAGVLAALAVALGTALTVSAIAVMTVAARKTANQLLGARPLWLDIGARVIAILAGLFILWIGLALAWAPPPPLMPGLG